MGYHIIADTFDNTKIIRSDGIYNNHEDPTGNLFDELGIFKIYLNELATGFVVEVNRYALEYSPIKRRKTPYLVSTYFEEYNISLELPLLKTTEDIIAQKRLLKNYLRDLIDNNPDANIKVSDKVLVAQQLMSTGEVMHELDLCKCKLKKYRVRRK